MDTIEPVFSKNLKSLIWGQVEFQLSMESLKCPWH